MALSTAEEKAAAKAKKTERWKDDRAYRRTVDPPFVARENAATAKYNNFKKLAIQFAKARASDFASFLEAHSGGKVKAPSTQGSQSDNQSHKLSPPPTSDALPAMDEAMLPPIQRYAALGSQAPTAESLERRRMARVNTDILKQLGRA
jgi:hypothetical protein